MGKKISGARLADLQPPEGDGYGHGRVKCQMIVYCLKCLRQKSCLVILNVVKDLDQIERLDSRDAQKDTQRKMGRLQGPFNFPPKS